VGCSIGFCEFETGRLDINGHENRGTIGFCYRETKKSDGPSTHYDDGLSRGDQGLFCDVYGYSEGFD